MSEQFEKIVLEKLDNIENILLKNNREIKNLEEYVYIRDKLLNSKQNDYFKKSMFL